MQPVSSGFVDLEESQNYQPPASPARMSIPLGLRRGVLRVVAHQDEDTELGELCRAVAQAIIGLGADEPDQVERGIDEMQRLLRRLGHEAREELEARESALDAADGHSSRGCWVVMDGDRDPVPASSPAAWDERQEEIDAGAGLDMPDLEYLTELELTLDQLLEGEDVQEEAGRR